MRTKPNASEKEAALAEYTSRYHPGESEAVYEALAASADTQYPGVFERALWVGANVAQSAGAER